MSSSPRTSPRALPAVPSDQPRGAAQPESGRQRTARPAGLRPNVAHGSQRRWSDEGRRGEAAACKRRRRGREQEATEPGPGLGQAQSRSRFASARPTGAPCSATRCASGCVEGSSKCTPVCKPPTACAGGRNVARPGASKLLGQLRGEPSQGRRCGEATALGASRQQRQRRTARRANCVAEGWDAGNAQVVELPVRDGRAAPSAGQSAASSRERARSSGGGAEAARRQGTVARPRRWAESGASGGALSGGEVGRGPYEPRRPDGDHSRQLRATGIRRGGGARGQKARLAALTHGGLESGACAPRRGSHCRPGRPCRTGRPLAAAAKATPYTAKAGTRAASRECPASIRRG